MKVSYKWLQEYISDKLPPVDDVVTALTMHAFEIEGVEVASSATRRGGEMDDWILDVKVLPNRAHDCLSHYGIASEVASILGLTRNFLLPNQELPKTDKINLSVTTKNCSRAVFVLIENAKVGESPEWLKEKLAVLGHRSINSVVDITNYLTYSFGQPMHAFDADKISKTNTNILQVSIRDAKDKEHIILLNDMEYSLDTSMMVIADGDKALDVAGVMGGKDTGVSNKTKNILLSLCSFDAVSVRKTSKRIGVRTDASQRFENEISQSLIDRALPYALNHISELTKGNIVGKAEFCEKPEVERTIDITVDKISKILGVSMDEKSIVRILAKQKINAAKDGDKIVVTVPRERLDLEIQENIAEEVGRLYGLDNIKPIPLAESSSYEVNREVYLSNKIKKILIQNGFSEIYTYAFTPTGDVELDNPLAGDKRFLRKNLLDKMEQYLETNFKFLDLLGMKSVKLFEIGKVFRSNGEFLHLSVGAKYPKGKNAPNADEEIAKTINTLKSELEISFNDISIVGGVAEIDLESVLSSMKVPDKYPEDLFQIPNREINYKVISPYPFAVRDVALFVPNDFEYKKLEDMIKEKTGDLVVRFSLFDKFTKEDKTSYAFRLVFQAEDRTLTEDEINSVMNPIYEMLKAEEGFEIR